MTLTDDDIQSLIHLPKVIESKNPAVGYKEEKGQRRCDLDMKAMSNGGELFSVFVRQNLKFNENFSIGLRYSTGDPRLGSLTLVRYNGPHGEYSRHPDRHFAKPHIHRITAAEIATGSSEPQERSREITDRYSTLESALLAFFDDIKAIEWESHFPNLRQARMFDADI